LDGCQLVVADANDANAMRSLARRARVVCTTVGPYARYGSTLVAACATEGTDCCDLSGEVPWMRRMRAEHGAAARESGARIVHACGFDSIPSDLGVWFVQREALRRFGAPSPVVKGALTGAAGGVSGGTVASMLDQFEETPGSRAEFVGSGERSVSSPETAPRVRARLLPHYDADLAAWTAPFVMAAVNTEIVRRSADRMRERYGASFRYEESMQVGGGWWGAAKAYGVTLGLAAAAGALVIAPLRKAIAPRLPQPGEGPGPERRASGHWSFRFVGMPPDGADAEPIHATVRGDADPGYGSTSKMLAAAAACLALDGLDAPGGFHTTASAMGDALVARLERSAGVSFLLVR